MIAERVEHIALDRRTREAQLIALSVDRDKLRSGLRKGRHRDRALIDPRGRATRRDLARKDEIVIARSGEHDLDVCALRTIAHHPARDASATHRKERVDEHRLAGTGLTGEHRETRREIETKLRNKSKVLHRELRDVRNN